MVLKSSLENGTQEGAEAPDSWFLLCLTSATRCQSRAAVSDVDAKLEQISMPLVKDGTRRGDDRG